MHPDDTQSTPTPYTDTPSPTTSPVPLSFSSNTLGVPSPTDPPATDPPATDEKHAALQAIAQNMNNATFDAALPKNVRNLTTANTTMVSLMRFLLDHIPQTWRTDVEEAVNTFEKVVQ